MIYFRWVVSETICNKNYSLCLTIRRSVYNTFCILKCESTISMHHNTFFCHAIIIGCWCWHQYHSFICNLLFRFLFIVHQHHLSQFAFWIHIIMFMSTKTQEISSILLLTIMLMLIKIENALSVSFYISGVSRFMTFTLSGWNRQ